MKPGGEESETTRTDGESGAFVRGTVTRITYRNEESGFGVLRAEVESGVERSSEMQTSSGASTTVVGILPSFVSTGTNIIARGEWQTHPKFGRQFRAFSVTEVEPTTADGLMRFLGSGTIKGFGPALAERIVAHFGEDTLKIIEQDPDRLLEVPGIGEKKLSELKSAWQVKQNRREVLLFFQNYDISMGLATRIFNTYGDRAIETVKRNPYVLSKDIWGVGFQTADRIALALGLDPTSTERIIAGIQHVLKKASDDGHCFLPREVLLAKTASLLRIEDESVIAHGLSHGALQGETVEAAGNVYLPHLHTAELSLARNITEMLERRSDSLTPIDQGMIDRACESAITTGLGSTQTPKVIRLSAEQQTAIRLAATQPLVVITGGPGCGKTTVVRTIASLFRSAGLSIKLAAPTGRAAQRLAEVCGIEASTIHRLLKFDPVRRSFLHDENTTLPLDALIIDESSMIDVQLASSLFRAIPRAARVIFVGDADQLPSVGPGLFLSDLLSIPKLRSVRLTTLFRREEESSITHIAHQINLGHVPHIPEPDGKTQSDGYFISCEDAADAAARIEHLVVDQIPRRFGFRGADVMVLSPMNQGELGIVGLNQRLQARLVPPRPGLPQIRVGNLEFRLGDRVIQRVNNYNLATAGVFNGDQGDIVGMDVESQSLFVKLWDGREIQYPSATLYQLDLAYALTVHRSQGSEVPVIVLALHDSHNILLERQLIYTAVTRAKKLLIVVGTKKALVLATKRSHSKRRYTALPELVARAQGKLDG